MNTEHEPLYNTYDPSIEMDEFREMVATNAYFRAEKRAFEDGHELDDWLEAEQGIRDQRRYWLE